MHSGLIEQFAQLRTRRIQKRYREYLEESKWRPSTKMVEVCAGNKSLFETAAADVADVSIPLILHYDYGDGAPPVMELALLFDVRRSNHGSIMRAYSVLHDRILHYRGDAIHTLRQGTTGVPVASLDAVMERYRRCADARYAGLRHELHALQYLALQDSVLQPSELAVVRNYLAGKELSAELQRDFLFYFETSFITPDAFDTVIEELRALSKPQAEQLLDVAVAVIEANGVVSPSERQAFRELATILDEPAHP